ncbi:tyrosinase family protein [Aspergillus stella-maris]|uniref:tyrosinase family protein n=1 Tax=Aspergillus stella-maris TaxID=1810926 RepID=UPI003CCD1604
MHLLFPFAALAAAVVAAPAPLPIPVPATTPVEAEGQGQCTSENALVRKEWSALTVDEQQGYIDALWCLRGKPSVLSSEQYPGVKDRVDDFVATHINYTMVIHRNGVLLPWHRHYVYLWETALREECGYKGTVPYWNWSLNSTLTINPIFDTSSTTAISLSGTGTYNATEQSLRPPEVNVLPPGTGGGCVLDGPFKDWPVNMGPFAPEEVYPYAALPAHSFEYNPRCLQRNLQSATIEKYNNGEVVASLQNSDSIATFLNLLDHVDGSLGAHGGGHVSVGPTMADVFSSPQDPVFMLHHGMIDRLWSQWQRDGRVSAEVQGERLKELNGTAVYWDPPTAPLVTLDSVMEFGPLDGPRRIGEVMDVKGGKYCYRYE